METDISGVTLGESDGRLKVVMPAHQIRRFRIIYTILLLVWVGVTIAMLVRLFNVSLASMRTLFIAILVLILVVWSYLWYRLGRSIWRYFQYWSASREIIYIDEEVLIVHRPFAVFGVTDGYEMEHVGPFFYHNDHRGIAFEYGSRAGLFAQGLDQVAARQLARLFNRQFFPGAMLEEE